MTPAVEKNEQTTIAQGAHADGALGSVYEEMIAIRTRSRRRELVPVALIDKVDGEDGLQDVLGRYLALLKARLVIGYARLARNVRLGKSAADDSQDGVGPLRGQFL